MSGIGDLVFPGLELWAQCQGVLTTLLLTDAEVRAGFDWESALGALRAAYSSDVGDDRFPARVMARGEGYWLRTLSGVPADTGLMGAKLIAANPRTGRASYLIPLFDVETVALIGLLDGQSVTGYRTAATSALAADLLAPSGPLRVAVLGSGFEARMHLRALAVACKIVSARVYSPNPDSRDRFVADLADVAVEIAAYSSPQGAVEDADVVVCAARAHGEQPILLGTWLQPGMTVLSIGSTLPEQREVDTDVIAAADLLVADVIDEVLHGTGDLLAAAAAGIDPAGRTVSLADVVSGRHPGRTGPDQVVLYKSVGSAAQDLAVAAMCAARARELGLGTELAPIVVPVQK